MNHWLIKSEPSSYSIDDLQRDKKTAWTGVRNYQARNFMKDLMKVGDLVFFYHSNSDPSGIVGVAKVVSESYPDKTQFDSTSKYFEPRATKEKPVWFLVDVAFVKKFPRVICLEELRSVKALAGMQVLQKGQRLSVQRVSGEEWKTVNALVGTRDG